MTAPITDAASAFFQASSATSSASTRPSDAAARQRLEGALRQLPADAGERADDIGREALVEPMQRINEAMRPFGVEFEQSEEGTRIITRIVDRDSGEVIRQIPAEEVLRVADRLGELQGRLIRQQV
ncbi:MAG TPA: flagellar protein FlaG [Halomonas sp.]|nr:flagellar protein FlaG [Halomonas sp.]